MLTRDEHWRHLAVSSDGAWIAAAEYESRVCVWSMRDRSLRGCFSTILNFGGDRLAISGGDTPRIFAGGYGNGGVAAYDATGSRIWQTRLHKVQSLTLGSKSLYVGLDRGPLHELSLSSGEVTDTHPGAVGVREQADDLIAWGRKWLSSNGRWKRPLDGWGVLDVQVGGALVTVAYAGGPIVAYDLASGDEVHRWALRGDVQPLRVCWHSDELRLITWCNPDYGFRTLRAGKLQKLGTFSLGAAEFMPGGAQVLCSDGTLRDWPSLTPVWTFARDQNASSLPG